MSTRRSKFQLSVEVLNQIKQGENKPTRIMYSANLSWKSLKEILHSLTTQDLIEEIIVSRSSKRAKKRYQITAKGENVLQYYSMVSGLIEIEPRD
ncbi:MAG: winged helix-turn-helix domain-containing protein [Candidatus Bathyarchaeota archaeon]|nr:winged helix-turn-helix domain-containing protein [Candidatus Bathyarchaeota archaeon]